MLCDSHCHLQDPKLRPDLEDVVARARDSGVIAMVTIGYDMPSSRAGIDIANDHEDIYATIGVHPHDARTVTANNLAEMEGLANSPKVVGIGEIGLDFYRDLSPREDQEREFRNQLDVARSLHLPVVIHAREADEEAFAVLAEHQRAAVHSWPRNRPLGVLHCFAGDLPLALRYIDLGFVISIAATVTYPAAERTRTVAAGIPLGSMTIETDAPYLPPQSIRGQRNEPARVRDVAHFIADLRDEDPTIVCNRTAETAAALFGLGDI